MCNVTATIGGGMRSGMTTGGALPTTTQRHTARAAVADGMGGLAVRDVVVTGPGPGEVLVEMRASGICHTDHQILGEGFNGILGHEGAGVVAAVGSGVTSVDVGDRVMTNWSVYCGTCPACRRGRESLCETDSPVIGGFGGPGHADLRRTTLDGSPVVRAFHIGSLSTAAVVRERGVLRIPDEIPFTSACIVGCGVATGFCSVSNAAGVGAGASVVVLGCGGVGLNAIQGARVAGAGAIIAIDVNPRRLEMARTFGATDVIQASPHDDGLLDAAKRVRGMTGGRGADYAFECTAVPALGAVPLAMVRHGGTAVQVSGIEQELTIDMRLFEWDKTYVNPLFGQCRPPVDLPRLLALYCRGDLLLDELVPRTYLLDEVSQAFDDMLAGVNGKCVVTFEPASA
jgi:S-(hydroxymethyl)glutathione dehydrogenase/alcohol dehydrogenase